MIKPATDSPSQSPMRGNYKHQMTPLKTRRKTSRKDQSCDVHTPNRLQLGNQCNALNSPSDSFLCSQENCPEVVWDYTSPKLPMGSKRREIKITVDEFLKSLSHNQAPECNTQNSNYIKLLEKWMAKQNTPVCVRKPIRTVKKDGKMRSRRVFEEIKQFMESIQQKNEDKIQENRNSKESTDESSLQKIESANESGILVNKKSFLEGDNTENDSIEDLWDDVDNSFIVKATQHLDVSCSKYNAQSKNVNILSTIPETITNTSNETKIISHEEEQNIGNTLNKAILDSDHQAQILLTQIMSCDWEFDSDDDLENGFIMGDEDLSLIPDEVLCGIDNKVEKKFERIEQSIIEQQCDIEMFNKKLQSNSDTIRQNDINRSAEITFGGSESNRVAFHMNKSEIELFNNFEDDSFDDESVLCRPEVLSWIDEVENKLSQSQKCTPEEIEKKKDEAIQRRKKNQSRAENS